MELKMISFFDDRQLGHAPLQELHNGGWESYQETPSRATDISSRLTNISRSSDFGIDPILAVHGSDYVDFLSTAFQQWQDAGRSGDAIGYTFPVVGRRPLNLSRIDARLGAYSFDAATPITAHSWDAAYWSAQSALSGLDYMVQNSALNAFALCRPPGHHAGVDYMGGYCYLNNAAIAARRAQTSGLGPVAILDIDYHHGNGTQDIFYDDPEIFFASIHADPTADYPFYWGHQDETGDGEGIGMNCNIPLARGADYPQYRSALGKALDAISKWGARFLVLSFGADTYAGDPISEFRLQTDDFPRIAQQISTLTLPTLIVMEGGYAVDALGENVGAFLSGFGHGT
jgi:acetoin utilization deacetylase AcuC-like enzyme